MHILIDQKMKCLIDFDVLRYELGHSSEYIDEDGELVVREWEFLQDLLEQKLFIIQEQTEADEPPCLYLTNDSITNNIYNRWAKSFGEELIEHKPNYRNEIATVKPYKGTRKNTKPVHYANLTAWVFANYEFKLANGVEADDLMAQDQTENTIICSRDKDLRQVAGNHYSWECGKQSEIGPIIFDRKGWVEDKNGKVFGGGEMFFLYQLLVGDPVDNIGGCPKVGHKGAMKLLSEVEGRKQLYMAILEAYKKVYGEDGLTYLIENARLLWLMRASDDIWEFPYEIK